MSPGGRPPRAAAPAPERPRALRKGYVRRDERGLFCEVSNGRPWKSVLAGEMKAGSVMGQHWHRKTGIHLYLVTGRARVVWDRPEGKRPKSLFLEAGEGIDLPPGNTHAIEFLETSFFVLLKDRSYDPKAPDTFAAPLPLG
jgi:dTDP-4-dehydrorhamnose 3,5-epimerase-like enzyme